MRAEEFEADVRGRIKDALEDVLPHVTVREIGEATSTVLAAITGRLDWPCEHEEAEVRGLHRRCTQCNAIVPETRGLDGPAPRAKDGAS